MELDTAAKKYETLESQKESTDEAKQKLLDRVQELELESENLVNKVAEGESHLAETKARLSEVEGITVPTLQGQAEESAKALEVEKEESAKAIE